MKVTFLIVIGIIVFPYYMYVISKAITLGKVSVLLKVKTILKENDHGKRKEKE